MYTILFSLLKAVWHSTGIDLNRVMGDKVVQYSRKEQGDGGIDGMQIHEASVFWDTGILSRHTKAKEGENKRSH